MRDSLASSTPTVHPYYPWIRAWVYSSACQRSKKKQAIEKRENKQYYLNEIKKYLQRRFHCCDHLGLSSQLRDLLMTLWASKCQTLTDVLQRACHRCCIYHLYYYCQQAPLSPSVPENWDVLVTQLPVNVMVYIGPGFFAIFGVFFKEVVTQRSVSWNPYSHFT